jgi:AraC-like DNA-binding protein
MSKSAATSIRSPAPEHGAWTAFPTGWSQLYGSFPDKGVSIEYHDIHPAAPVNWARSFHPNSLEICINLEGEARIEFNGSAWQLGPAQVIVYAIGTTPPAATRAAGQRHRFITIELAPAFLRQRLPDCPGELLPVVAAAMKTGAAHTAVHPPRAFTSAQSATMRALRQPPVPLAARPLWYEARLLEWLSESLFDEAGELFCHRQQRLDRERIERVKIALVADLENPPRLTDLAKMVAISPFYLSRTFSRIVGESIPEYLRRARIERAAALLRSGSHNVTEAAFAVGYSSLGHFSKNFRATMGCWPTEYSGASGPK